MLTSVASIIVTIVVLASIIGCGVILWNQSRVKLPKGKVETTGHAWDGLEEYNNPLPKWWMYLFWITVVFALAYVFLYPALGNNKGLLDWSSTGQWQKEINVALFTEHWGNQQIVTEHILAVKIVTGRVIWKLQHHSPHYW